MTGNGSQPYLPFDEPPNDEVTPILNVGLRRSPPESQPSRDRLPLSLRAFSTAWGCADPETAMRRACADLRTRTEQYAPPYALTPMLEALSVVRAKGAQSAGAHGRLHASSTGWTIYRRTDLPWRRGRFTEAHELGHILLYEKLAFNRELLDDLHSDAAHLQVEKLCDIAGAELLMPGDDLGRDLALHSLETLGDYHWFYDRYMTSHRALLRRVAEVAANTALTVWTWQAHPNGANWRIRESYCQHLADIYIPRGMSRRRLSPDVVGLALEVGAATARGRIDVGRRRYTGVMTALYPNHRSQAELPMYHGQTVRDEHSASIYVLHRSLTTTAGTPTPAFRRRGYAS